MGRNDVTTPKRFDAGTRVSLPSRRAYRFPRRAGSVLYICGPDGAGKSRLVRHLEDHQGAGDATALGRVQLISGTHIETWPEERDGSRWHEAFEQNDIDESAITDPHHIVEKVHRFEDLTRLLMEQRTPPSSVLLVDSPPLVKTLMWDYITAWRWDGPDSYIEERMDRFSRETDYESAAFVRVYVNVVPWSNMSSEEMGVRLQNRIKRRLHDTGVTSAWDPTSPEGSAAQVVAHEKVMQLLLRRGDRIVDLRMDEIEAQGNDDLLAALMVPLGLADALGRTTSQGR